MKQIPDKNTGDLYTAEEFTKGIKDDLQQMVPTSGQVFDEFDDLQLAKAVAAYVAISDHYVDSGTPTEYILSPVDNFEAPPALTNGLRVRFVPANTNIGTATVNVNGLGPISITQNGLPITANTITAGRFLELWYNQANNWFDIIFTEGVGNFTDIDVVGLGTFGGRVTANDFHAVSGGSLANPALRIDNGGSGGPVGISGGAAAGLENIKLVINGVEAFTFTEAALDAHNATLSNVNELTAQIFHAENYIDMADSTGPGVSPDAHGSAFAYNSATLGLVIGGTGSTYSNSMINGAGSTVWRNPAGTQNMQMLGGLTVAVGIVTGGGNSIMSSDYDDFAFGDLSANRGMTIQSSATGRGGVAFSRANVNGISSRAGRFDFNHNLDRFEMLISDAARMTLDATEFNLTANVNVTGDARFTSSSLADQFIFENNDGGASSAPDIVMYRNSSTPVASDEIGNLTFRGKNALAGDFDYARIVATIEDPTSTAEDGVLTLRVGRDGSQTVIATFTGSTLATSFSGSTYVPSGNVHIGGSAPLGRLHVESGSAGVITPDGSIDDLIIESAAAGGISIFTPSASTGSIAFGSPDDANGANVQWNFSAALMTVGTRAVGADLRIDTGNGVQTLYLDGGTQAATFAGAINASSGGSLTGTWTDLGSVTTIDINGGTIDGTVIGGSAAAAGRFTSIGIGVAAVGDFHVQGATDTRIGGTGNNYYTYFQTNSGASKGAIGALISSFRVQSQSAVPLELFNTQGLGLTIANGTGDTSVAGKLTADGGALIGVMNKVDGGTAYGIRMYDTDDTSWGFIMSQSGIAKSMAGTTACTSLDGRTGFHLRSRVASGPTFGWIFEGADDDCKASLTANTGDLYVKGTVNAGGNMLVGGTAILRTIATSHTVLGGGTSETNGAALKVFGGSHALTPGDFQVLTGGTNRGGWDNTNVRWDLQGNPLAGVGDVTTTAGPQRLAGSGSPEGVVTAPVGSTFQRSDGGAGTSFYVKESGAGNIGWVGK